MQTNLLMAARSMAFLVRNILPFAILGFVPMAEAELVVGLTKTEAEAAVHRDTAVQVVHLSYKSQFAGVRNLDDDISVGWGQVGGIEPTP